MGVDDTLRNAVTYVQLLALSLIIWDLYVTRAKLRLGMQVYVLGAYVAVASTVWNYLQGI